MHHFLELRSCISDGQIWLVHGVAIPARMFYIDNNSVSYVDQ